MTVPPELDRFTTPILMVKRATNADAYWQDLGAAPMAYNLYEGALRAFTSHVPPLACGMAGTASLPGRREERFTPSAGSRYYLMTASNCFAEGESGSDPALNVCPP